MFNEGTRGRGDWVRAAVLPGTGLLGIATSRKIGSKPRRNRAKRRVKEAARLNGKLPQWDLVLVVSQDAVDVPFPALRGDVERAVAEAIAKWAEKSAYS
ncbi:ribonuclease P protein component [bacterium]|nr:MAG: ribonuclease P protein component [bacterium]